MKTCVHYESFINVGWDAHFLDDFCHRNAMPYVIEMSVMEQG